VPEVIFAFYKQNPRKLFSQGLHISSNAYTLLFISRNISSKDPQTSGHALLLHETFNCRLAFLKVESTQAVIETLISPPISH